MKSKSNDGKLIVLVQEFMMMVAYYVVFIEDIQLHS